MLRTLLACLGMTVIAVAPGCGDDGGGATAGSSGSSGGSGTTMATGATATTATTSGSSGTGSSTDATTTTTSGSTGTTTDTDGTGDTGMEPLLWTFVRPVVVTSFEPQVQSNYQVPVRLTAADYDNIQASGQDIRFSTDGNASSESELDLQYWFENFNSNGDSLIWVKVPTLAAAGDTTIYMYVGNPAAVSAEVTFAAMWPARFVSNNSFSTDGAPINLDWYEIQLAHTITLSDVAAINKSINAKRIVIRGNIIGSAGELAAQGPGAGSQGGASGSGGGGASYGGLGSAGADGMDVGGPAGPLYGTADMMTIEPGSGGGAGGSGGAGGRGGAAIRLTGQYVSVLGQVQFNGANGAGFGLGGGGGGSGGGVLISAHTIDVSGTLSAAGGDAGNPAQPDDSGGGGGGGRVKLFYSQTLTPGTTDVTGGTGGDMQPAGGDGTLHTEQTTLAHGVTVALGVEAPI